MAGQQLERAKREGIGAAYLKNLLARPDRGSYFARMRDIHRAFADSFGRLIPTEVNDLLDLHSMEMKRTLVDRETLPVVYLGKRQRKQTEDVETTLEIARRVVFEPERPVFAPLHVRIAGVDRRTDEDMPRIVALTYDASDTFELERASLSLSEIEYQRFSRYISSANPYLRFGTIQEALKDPYEAAGYITQAMVDQTKNNDGSVHTHMLHIDVGAIPNNQASPHQKEPITNYADLEEALTELRLVLGDRTKPSIHRVDGQLLVSLSPNLDAEQSYFLEIPDRLSPAKIFFT